MAMSHVVLPMNAITALSHVSGVSNVKGWSRRGYDKADTAVWKRKTSEASRFEYGTVTEEAGNKPI